MTIKDKAEFDIRPATEDDVPFIANSWLQSFRNNSVFAKDIKKQIYFSFHHRIVMRILKNPLTSTYIACDKQDPTVIYGYLVYSRPLRASSVDTYEQPPVIHFLYVKESFRRMGIARKLVEDAKVDLLQTHFTHLSKDGARLQDRFSFLTYNPYLT